MAGWLFSHSDRRKAEADVPVATGLRHPPEGRGIGDPRRIALPPTPDFAWLDDVAAAGDAALARKRIAEWTAAAADWTPGDTGRRLIRWIDHAGFLEPHGASPETLATLSRQTAFVHRRWQTAPAGIPRINALAGLVTATLTLKGLPNRIAAEAATLAETANALVAADGGIPSRNPEQALDLLAVLLAASAALERSGSAPTPLRAAIVRLAGGLRSLRHADGGLGRFHGGGAGAAGKLDAALAEARARTAPQDGAMGFQRLQAARSTVIVDAAAPPATPAAHASSLAFELTSGRRPIVVSCGAGDGMRDWARAARATDSHSTLSLEGASSSRLGKGDLFAEPAGVFGLHRQIIPEGTHLQISHDGWRRSHGLTHTRNLLLPADGRRLIGEDALSALSVAERRRFLGLNAPRFAIRFHLHPDVDPVLHPAADTVILRLRSGEVWHFTHESAATLTLEGSSYLDAGQKGTKQIVLAGLVAETTTRIGWTFAKAQDTPLAIRDLDRDDDPALS